VSTAVAALPSESISRPTTLRERLDLPRRATFACAVAVLLLVGLLLGFIAWNGVQLFVASHVPVLEILSPTWSPSSEPVTFGILPFIVGTVGVMVVAAIIATPLSVGLALFMAGIAPNWARNVTRPAMEIFVGIPSVVYGWLGLTMLVPFLRTNFHAVGFNLGFSWFAGSLVLALMVLPTIASISYDALIAVPGDLRQASLALGTTRWQTLRHMLLRAASTGIVTAVVLGMLRAAGEALAVQMVIGNRPVVPTSLTQPMTTLTSQITLDMGNTVAGSAWNDALWTMGLVLLLMSLAFVSFVRFLGRRGQLA
jgi:phosphate transport system permease protein